MSSPSRGGTPLERWLDARSDKSNVNVVRREFIPSLGNYLCAGFALPLPTERGRLWHDDYLHSTEYAITTPQPILYLGFFLEYPSSENRVAGSTIEKSAVESIHRSKYLDFFTRKDANDSRKKNRCTGV